MNHNAAVIPKPTNWKMCSPAEHIKGFSKYPKCNGGIKQIQLHWTSRPLKAGTGGKVYLLSAWQIRECTSNISICEHLWVLESTTVKSHSLLKPVKDLVPSQWKVVQGKTQPRVILHVADMVLILTGKCWHVAEDQNQSIPQSSGYETSDKKPTSHKDSPRRS